jgi:hypothetical protein
MSAKPKLFQRPRDDDDGNANAAFRVPLVSCRRGSDVRIVVVCLTVTALGYDSCQSTINDRQIDRGTVDRSSLQSRRESNALLC